MSSTEYVGRETGKLLYSRQCLDDLKVLTILKVGTGGNLGRWKVRRRWGGERGTKEERAHLPRYMPR